MLLARWAGPFGTSSARDQVAWANGRPLLQRGVLHGGTTAPRCQQAGQPSRFLACAKLHSFGLPLPSAWPTQGGHAMGQLANQLTAPLRLVIGFTAAIRLGLDSMLQANLINTNMTGQLTG